ncbi:MAG: hypothetical protein LBJ18_01480 [Rickettsiales bacterium]|nr:hypothetical protein [Rickettsiales bacterium]
MKQQQAGSFLLQALLALSLIIAFMPFFASRLARRDIDAQMLATTHQLETAQTAARIFVRENISNFPYNPVKYSGDAFSDTLEPYGLPLGFISRTIMGQDISLTVIKDKFSINAELIITGGKISGLRRAELARRLGFYASESDGAIILRVPLDEDFSDIVKRKEPSPDENSFMSDLDLGGFGLENGGGLFGRVLETDIFTANTLSVFGLEDGRKNKNKIDNLTVAKSVFQSASGESALAVAKGSLAADRLETRTISKFGDTGNLTVKTASVYDFAMTAGRTGFNGPAKWNVNGNLETDNITFTVERLDISSFINASRGQDVFINPDSLEYNTQSGISAGILRAANITLRDQTSAALERGNTGAVILDIRPAGTSVLPDALIESVDNSIFRIISKYDDDSGKETDCKGIIAGLDFSYNQKSLSQNIICQYVFWQRLEKRIDLKKCMLDGKSGCK